MDNKDIAEMQEELIGKDEGVSHESEPEETLPKSRVTELIKKAKYKGEKKLMDELEAAKQQIEELKAQQAQQSAPAAAPVQQAQQMGGMQQQQPQFDPQQMQAQIMQQIQAEMLKRQQEEHQAQLEKEVSAVANQYYAKMAQGKEHFDDFEAVTADFDPAAFPQLVYMANEADNTAQIIYELKKNPQKLATLATLVERSPQMARSELAKMSNAIKTNQEAVANAKQPNDPLSRLKPTQAGADSGTPTSIRDLKNSPFLRG
jgi:hypothetical protein